MLLYQRDAKGRLLFLRVFFLSLITTIVCCLQSGYTNGAYFLAVVFFCGCLPTVTDLRIEDKRLVVTMYYLFGTIPTTIRPAIDEITLYATYATDERYSNAETLLGCFFAFFPVRAKFQGLMIKRKGRRRERKIRLSDDEYKIIQKFLAQANQ